MHQPAAFRIDDPALLHALIADQALGTWACVSPQEGLLMNHIPFQLDLSRGAHGTLVGHVARGNPVWKACLDAQDGSAVGAPSIVAFHGPQAYVSPNWYPSKQQDGKAVPTWNYAVVQAHGLARAVDDRARLLQIVSQLTQQHEATQPQPWQVSDAPPAYIEAMLAGIVGIEIEITRLEGKWKMSQNHSAPNRAGVVAGLGALPSDEARAVAHAVTQRGPK
jgi:transcriptional regulator